MNAAAHSHGHEPRQIAARLAQENRPSYVGDAVLGAIDGCVTTLAIVGGAVGAELSPGTVIVLGAANLFGDGFSMAAGNFQRARSNLAHAALIRRTEEAHVRDWPDGEREEVRQIYAQKGFAPPLLDKIVEVITADRARWIDTMVSEEWGVGRVSQKPGRVAATTFVTFVVVGMAPLVPFFWAQAANLAATAYQSALLTSFIFVGIGVWRAKIFKESPWLGGIETLAAGGGAALIAFAIARTLRDFVGL